MSGVRATVPRKIWKAPRKSPSETIVTVVAVGYLASVLILLFFAACCMSELS